MGIIKSILDDDLYKFTMQQAVLHQHPGVTVKYKLKIRSKGVDLRPILARLKDEIQEMSNLSLSVSEKRYLANLGFFKSDYLDYLSQFRFDPSQVLIQTIDKAPYVSITIQGSWVQTILWEVPLMALISELYLGHKVKTEGGGLANYMECGLNNLKSKITNLEDSVQGNFKFADFGTRRRFSFGWHDKVVEELKKCSHFVGTSNVYLAKKHSVKPIGTMAHEWIMAHQQLTHLQDFQHKALMNWAKEYKGDLGIALTDTINTKVFLNDFDKYLAKLYDGVRHDSGDPIQWGHDMINHYRELGIVPKSKTLVFSDGLDMDKAIRIYNRFKLQTKLSFGIGTNLTNDFPIPALSQVIKLVEVNGKPVAKLSNDSGKNMCEEKYFTDYLKQVFELVSDKKEKTNIPSHITSDLTSVINKMRSDLSFFFSKKGHEHYESILATCTADSVQVLETILQELKDIN